MFGLVKDQSTYPAIAVIGAQGLGKTTLIEYLLSLLKQEKIVLDPHYKAGAWPGMLSDWCRYELRRSRHSSHTNISADVKERDISSEPPTPTISPHLVALRTRRANQLGR